MSINSVTSDRPSEGSERAAQACRQCSQLKRKCPRQLPQCFLCVRLGKTCDYPLGRKPYGMPHPGETQFQSPPAKATRNDGGSHGQLFPDAFFLDHELFEPMAHSATTDTLSVPADVMRYIGQDMHALCDQYFDSVDTWFPFVSRKRLIRALDGENAFCNGNSDAVSLLLLSMRLIMSTPSDSRPTATSDPLYRTTRNFLNDMEEWSPMSLEVFQTLVLVALYEVGHGLFPVAYLTLGRAARIGSMRGIHDRNNARQLFKVPHTWTHWEEERRTWWAVSILERYINLEPKGLPLATPEPAQGDLLPTADSSWLRGEIGVNQALFTTGFSPVSEIGSFARVCQAAHILGRVINHRNIRKDTLSKDLILDEALQLSATLTALDKHLAHHMDKSLDDDAVTVVDVALCTVARLTLYGTYACNSPDALSERLVEETALQSASIDGIKQIIGTRAATLAQYVLRQGKQHLDASSPLVLQCLYDAATECQWFIREGDVVEGAERTMELLMEAIRLLSQRWSVGGKYLDLLKKREHL